MGMVVAAVGRVMVKNDGRDSGVDGKWIMVRDVWL